MLSQLFIYLTKQTSKRINDDYTDLMSKINRVNDVATEQKKQKKKKKKIEEVIESVIDNTLPKNDFWWEEDIFDKNDK